MTPAHPLISHIDKERYRIAMALTERRFLPANRISELLEIDERLWRLRALYEADEFPDEGVV